MQRGCESIYNEVATIVIYTGGGAIRIKFYGAIGHKVSKGKEPTASEGSSAGPNVYDLSGREGALLHLLDPRLLRCKTIWDVLFFYND